MALIELFFGICLLRKGPQDIPYSGFLFWIVISLYLIVSVLVLALQSNVSMLPAQLLVQLIYTTLFVWICLWLSNQRARFLQTIIAVLGTDAIISVAALPPLAWIANTPESQSVFIFLLGLMLWQVIIIGHILRHALNAHFSFGFGLGLVYFFLSIQLMANLFPFSE